MVFKQPQSAGFLVFFHPDVAPHAQQPDHWMCLTYTHTHTFLLTTVHVCVLLTTVHVCVLHFQAHPDVFNILLQIMEDGRLTSSQV